MLSHQWPIYVFSIRFVCELSGLTPALCETLLLLSTGKTSSKSSRRCFRPLESQTLSRTQRRSLHQWKSLLVGITAMVSVEEIRAAASKSAATRSRRCITISVDDTNDPRYAKTLSYGYNTKLTPFVARGPCACNASKDFGSCQE